MATRFHTFLKVVAFNANGILGQRNDLSKQVGSSTDRRGASFEKASRKIVYLKLPYLSDRPPSRLKSTTAIAVRICVPHTYIDLCRLSSTEAIGISIPIGNKEILLAALYITPGRAWSDAEVTGG
jgi:hypothetical protein